MSSEAKKDVNNNNNKNNDITVFKILTIGESGVGKTSILRRYVENKFERHHLATIGIDFQSKTIKIKNKDIKLKIWDTAGQERYRNIANQTFRGADGIILVFDITDEYSFSRISDWMEQINANISKDEIGLILIGNKCDLEDRKVPYEKGEEKARELGIDYYETSALNGKGINDVFEELVKLILQKNKPKNNTGSRTISISSNKPEDIVETNEKKKGCC